MAGMIEAIREVRTVLPIKEIPLSVAKILSFSGSRLMSRVTDAMVGAIAGFGSGIGLDIVEGLGVRNGMDG